MRSFKKIDRFRVEKKPFKNGQKYCHIQSVHSDQHEDVITKITSLEKRQFIHVLEGIKQRLKAQDQ